MSTQVLLDRCHAPAESHTPAAAAASRAVHGFGFGGVNAALIVSKVMSESAVL